MDIPSDTVLLRIFISTEDRYGSMPLYYAIVAKARDLHLAGATVLRGMLGYGRSARLHEAHLFSPDESPVVIEICDAEDKIETFLPVLDEMILSGLVTLEKAHVVHYGHKHPGSIDRLKAELRRQHPAPPPFTAS
jgi:PII-like signaling protein